MLKKNYSKKYKATTIEDGVFLLKTIEKLKKKWNLSSEFKRVKYKLNRMFISKKIKTLIGNEKIGKFNLIIFLQFL